MQAPSLEGFNSRSITTYLASATTSTTAMATTGDGNDVDFYHDVYLMSPAFLGSALATLLASQG